MSRRDRASIRRGMSSIVDGIVSIVESMGSLFDLSPGISPRGRRLLDRMERESRRGPKGWRDLEPWNGAPGGHRVWPQDG